MADHVPANSNKKELPNERLLDSSATCHEKTSSNEDVPGNSATLNIPEIEVKAIAKGNSELKNEDSELPDGEDSIQEALPREPGPNVREISPDEVASRAEKAASVARIAANSCQTLSEATSDAIYVGQKRISKALKKSEGAVEHRHKDHYAEVAEVLEVAVILICRKAHQVAAAADEAETAANGAVDAAAVLYNPDNVTPNSMRDADWAEKFASAKAVDALKAEYAALKEMQNCYTHLDYEDFLGVSVDLGPRSTRSCCDCCDKWDCVDIASLAVFIFLLFVGVALAAWQPKLDSLWPILMLLVVLIGFPLLGITYWNLKCKKVVRKESELSRNRRIVGEISDRLAVLDFYFSSHGIHNEHAKLYHVRVRT